MTLSGGEVLLRKDWLELAEYARTLGFVVRFYTNGTLVTEETADKIVSVKPLDVEISLLRRHRSHARLDRTAQKAHSDKTIAGIKRLRARGVNVLLKCVLMKHNVDDEYEQMKALAAELGCDIFFDIEVTPKNNGSRTPTELTGDGESMVAIATRDLRRKVRWGYGRYDRRVKLRVAGAFLARGGATDRADRSHGRRLPVHAVDDAGRQSANDELR